MDKERHAENSHTTSGDPLAKRKRGRPRKHFKLDDSNNNRSPPGFSRTQHQDEALVGQHVTGVIEATFEDGFLLSVKVGGSDTMLRGVVFKPGHFHPLSADNDVAPHVPMIRRNNDLLDHRRSAAQRGRKSRLHEKRGARALVPVPIQPKPLLPPVYHGHIRTETESQVSGDSNGKPFETLFTQVMEKGQVHTESEEQALSIEPLQAIHPVHPVHMPKPMPSNGRGNMTELLQAVQENVRGLLKHEGSDISGVLVPWLYIGMCFSSFCWHVEDHHLYSMNYMHWGAPKLWYGVAGKDAVKLEEAMRKHLPDLFEEQPDLLHKLVTQLSPSKLKTAGVPVHRCVQHAGEFVLTFPRAYHAGFNCGFNCAEAVNVAPVDWLPHGQIAIELYCQQGRKTSISHDKLLLGAAREVVKADWELNLLKKNTIDNLWWKEFSGKDGILAATLKARIDMERTRREVLCSSSLALKMHSNFDATNERECCICFFDLHLSAAGCRCSPEKYSCLTHVKQLCSCPWVAKYYLFRYDMDELNVLLEAVEGKLSSVYRWARQDLGLALSEHLSGSKMETSEEEPQAGALLGKDLQLKVTSREDLSRGLEKTLLLKVKEEQLTPSHCMKPVKEEESISMTAAKSTSGKKSSQSVPDDVILLSDDEHDIPRKQVSEKRDAVSSGKHLKIQERPTHVLALEAPSKTAAPMIEKQANSLPDRQITMPLPTNDQRAVQGDVTSSVSHAEVNAVADGLAHNTSNQDGVNPTSSKSKISGGLAIQEVVDGIRSTSGTPSCSQNNSPDRIIRQKGPRIAKVVRRINCNVEPLNYGCVLSGKSWCNRRAIFPKGFRSRVKYINVLDPTRMSFYVSEILDTGRNSPLFMVYLEGVPSEVFAHLSPTRCWEMVRDRVNQEISKQHKAGKLDLPPLQPSGSPDGFEMFGYTSPAILQAIEALDVNRVCTEYWDSRPYSRPQVQFPANALLLREANTSIQSSDVRNLQKAPRQRLLPAGTKSNLKVLLKKANMEELSSLQEVLSESNIDLVTELVKEEIQKRG